HGFVDNRDNGVQGAGSLGDDQKSIGDRNTPTASYAMFSPRFHFDAKKGQYIGGQFYDGREHTLKGQAGGPPTNPVEMGIPTKEFLAKRLEQDKLYNQEFKTLYGDDIFENSDKAYEMMAQAIAAFETTKEFAPDARISTK
ncbi:c-type cytochrome, partial [Aduncisulcus paluster]